MLKKHLFNSFLCIFLGAFGTTHSSSPSIDISNIDPQDVNKIMPKATFNFSSTNSREISIDISRTQQLLVENQDNPNDSHLATFRTLIPLSKQNIEDIKRRWVALKGSIILELSILPRNSNI